MPNVPEIPDIKTNSIETPRVEVPVIRNLELPPILVPINRKLPIPVVDVPMDGIPSYEPIDAPTTEQFRKMINAQQEPKKEEELQDKPRGLPDLKGITDALKQVPQVPQVSQVSQPQEQVTPPVPKIDAPTITVPYIGAIPVPSTQTVVLSGTTATASVAAALIGKSMVEWLVGKMKPIINQIFIRGKQLLNRDLTPYETQLLFSMELDKKTLKLLKKEQKVEKLRQKQVFVESQQHPHISLRKEKKD
jgi:hypothetical protein